eukprot:8182014-Pyramimonas_sp.AAC.1
MTNLSSVISGHHDAGNSVNHQLETDPAQLGRRANSRCDPERRTRRASCSSDSRASSSAACA